MNAYGNEYGVAIFLLQLFDDLRASRTVHAALTRKVLQQYTACCGCRFDVYEPVSLVNVAAGRQEHTHANEK